MCQIISHTYHSDASIFPRLGEVYVKIPNKNQTILQGHCSRFTQTMRSLQSNRREAAHIVGTVPHQPKKLTRVSFNVLSNVQHTRTIFMTYI